MKRKLLHCVALATLLGSTFAVVGCGSDNETFVNFQQQTGEIRLRHDIAAPRKIPAEVTAVRLFGLDGNGNTIFGPIEQAIAQENVFSNVPITVVAIKVEYLKNGVVIGTFTQSVSVPPGGSVVINDPNFQDVPSAGTPLAEKFIASWYSAGSTVFTNAFPGVSALWDIDTDFSLKNGISDEFDNVVDLSVGGNSFPSDQTLAGATFLAPLFSTAEGLPRAAASTLDPLAGTRSGVLAPVMSSRLFQQVDLTSSAAPINLSWRDRTNVSTDNFGSAFHYQVVVRNQQGDVVATAFESTDNALAATDRTFNLDAFAGQRITLSFEQQNGCEIFVGADGVQIDNVSVTDASATERVTNGNFETGDLTGWTNNSAPQSQHMRSATRTVTGLDVTRTVYVRPDQMWLRYYDEFTNNTGAAITTTLKYDNNLGSDGFGHSQFVTDSGDRAISSSDGGGSDSDIGFVFGSNATLSGFSVNTGNFSWQYDVTIQPGETRAVCMFVLQSGQKSGTNIPTAIEDLARAILAGFGNQAIFTEGLSSEQRARIINL